MDASKTIVGTNEIEDQAVTGAKVEFGTLLESHISGGTQIPRTKLAPVLPASGVGNSTTVSAGLGWQTVCTYAGSSFWNARRTLFWVQTGWAGSMCSTSMSGTGIVEGRLVVDGEVVAQRQLSNGTGSFDPHLMGSITLASAGAKTVTFQVQMFGGTSVTINNVAITSLQF